MSDKTLSIQNWKREYKVCDEIQALLNAYCNEEVKSNEIKNDAVIPLQKEKCRSLLLKKLDEKIQVKENKVDCIT